MAVGPKDAIDKKLVGMYKDKQTGTVETKSVVDPEKILQGMNMMAFNNRIFFDMNRRGEGARKGDLSINRRVNIKTVAS